MDAPAELVSTLHYDHLPIHDAMRALLRKLPQGARERSREAQSQGVPGSDVLAYLASTTRPGTLVPAPPVPTLIEAARRFESIFQVAEEDAVVTAKLLELIESPGAQGKQIHDANIAATMCRHNIPYILTHTADFVKYAPEVAVLPLVGSAETMPPAPPPAPLLS